MPVIKQLFSNNDTSVTQSDIVMLLTPRIVRTHELTPQDVGPIRIGTQANLGLSGPPPLLAQPGAAPVGLGDARSGAATAQAPPAQPAFAQPTAPPRTAATSALRDPRRHRRRRPRRLAHRPCRTDV